MLKLDRMNLVGEMSASIAHEIRNPLTTVRGFLQLLYNRESDGLKDYYEIMIGELDRANLIIKELLTLAKNKLVNKAPVSLNYVLDSLLPLLNIDALEQEKEIFSKKNLLPT